MGSRFHKIAKDIEKYFDDAPIAVFTYPDLAQILKTNRPGWQLPATATTVKFVEFLTNDSFLTPVELKSDEYASQKRFAWKKADALDVALAIRKNSFFSHGTAVGLHQLRDDLRSEIYINHEQTPKPQPRGVLIQENVDRAFAGMQRQSKLIYRIDDQRIVVVNGKFTGRLGVEELEIRDGRRFPVTSLERTLIDITVRPKYAGGVAEVLKVYRKLRGRISTDDLLRMLREIDYAYPYHQAIGFYMQRADFPASVLAKISQLPRDIDFYLDYGLGEGRLYDAAWRVFYPNDLPTG